MKNINAYLLFDGTCHDAMKFYAKCLGAELHAMKYSEGPKGECPEGTAQSMPKGAENRIMHACVSKGAAVLMASDIPPGTPFQQGNNFHVTLNCESVAEIEKLFGALTEKATIKMPLQETFWAQRFAMFIDKFGVHWMLNLDKARQN